MSVRRAARNRQVIAPEASINDKRTPSRLSGIVVFEEVLAAKGMGHSRLRSRRRGDCYIMHTYATGIGVDRDHLVPAENGGNLAKVPCHSGE
jgi:hypothetical protein